MSDIRQNLLDKSVIWPTYTHHPSWKSPENLKILTLKNLTEDLELGDQKEGAHKPCDGNRAQQ